MSGLSIIICTYNPEEEVFTRCLRSVSKLQLPEGVAVECLVVDNNSKIPVKSLSYVKPVIDACPWIRVIEETKAGLSYARAAGFSASSGDMIVFFDDDNAPQDDYLLQVSELSIRHPQVGIWGPGRIEVEYLAPVDDWMLQNKKYFQQRDFKETYIDNNFQMQFFYPPGTGMVLKRQVMQSWADKFKANTYSVLGRTGNSMESSEDIQMIYTALHGGFFIGSSPALALNHLTSQRKSNFGYVKRLAFGISVSGAKTANEIGKKLCASDIPSKSLINYKLFLFYINYLIKEQSTKRQFLISQIHFFAGAVGKYRLVNRSLPYALKDFINRFELEKTS